MNHPDDVDDENVDADLLQPSLRDHGRRTPARPRRRRHAAPGHHSRLRADARARRRRRSAAPRPSTAPSTSRSRPTASSASPSTLGVDPVSYLASHQGAWHGGLWNPAETHLAPLNAVVGGAVTHAVGWAMGARLDHTDGVAIAYFGDGASSQGDVHEAMNFAGVYQPPRRLLLPEQRMGDLGSDRSPGRGRFGRGSRRRLRAGRQPRRRQRRGRRVPGDRGRDPPRPRRAAARP